MSTSEGLPKGDNCCSPALEKELTELVLSNNEESVKMAPELVKTDRFCAFCLESLTPEKVLFCGGCHRRTYCCKECQRKDWSTKALPHQSMQGQGHKNWCKLQVCEEGIDWKVAPVEGKGFGVIALRKIQPRERIMVEACQLSPIAHPETKNLVPEGGTLEGKFRLNAFAGDGFEGLGLCLRMSRANHACKPNAGHTDLPKMNLEVMFANSEIQEGEEICISYVSLRGTLNTQTGQQAVKYAARQLETKWGIICPPTCICFDKEFQEMTMKCKELEGEMMKWAERSNCDKALNCARKVLDLLDKFGSTFMVRNHTLFDAFQWAVMKKNTLEEAKNYLREMIRFEEATLHPTDDQLLEHKEWLSDPSLHPYYMVCQ